MSDQVIWWDIGERNEDHVSMNVIMMVSEPIFNQDSS